LQRLMKISEVSRIIGCHNVTLKRWVREGRGPKATMSPGGRYMFKEADFINWQNSLQTIQPLKGTGKTPQTS
jgi:DNA-binding transcriptional MerR regulator